MEMTMERPTVAEAEPGRIDALAGMLRVGSVLVHDEPTALGLRDLSESGVFEGLPDGFEETHLVEGFRMLNKGLSACLGESDGIAPLQREWLRLFAGVGEPEVPSWANYYLDSESRVLGAETLAVRALYAKHGLRTERPNGEPDDDLGLMLRFLAHLMEVGAQDDARELLAKHILPWLPRWHYLGERYAASEFYRGVVEFVFGALLTCASGLGFSYNENSQSFSFRKDTK